MEVYIVTGYNSYTSLDTMDEQLILGVFHSIEKANKYKDKYLKNANREYGKIDIEMYIVQ